VDAVHRAGIDAGGVFCPDAGFGNDIGHRPPPISESTVCLFEKNIQAPLGYTLAHGAID
jgi:hypothetical protein